MDKPARKQHLFQLLNEIGIIQQLAVSELNRRLPDGLHLSHFIVINHLVRLGDGKTPLALAQAFQVTKPTITNTLSRLAERGLIEVKDNPADGRSKLVYLTGAGAAFHGRAIAALEPVLELADAKLDLERLNAILPQLQVLRAHLDENRSV